MMQQSMSCVRVEKNGPTFTRMLPKQRKKLEAVDSSYGSDGEVPPDTCRNDGQFSSSTGASASLQADQTCGSLFKERSRSHTPPYDVSCLSENPSLDHSLRKYRQESMAPAFLSEGDIVKSAEDAREGDNISEDDGTWSMEGDIEKSETGPDVVRPYIVIDGTNVAMSHGDQHLFSCRGIQLCVDWFRVRGYGEITAFVPRWRKETLGPDFRIKDQDILLQLERERVLVFTPSRHVAGRHMVCHDDRYILKLAVDVRGVVVSNDDYEDLVEENHDFRRVVEHRRLKFTFDNGCFIPLATPHGLTVDSLLCYQVNIAEIRRLREGKPQEDKELSAEVVALECSTMESCLGSTNFKVLPADYTSHIERTGSQIHEGKFSANIPNIFSSHPDTLKCTPLLTNLQTFHSSINSSIPDSSGTNPASHAVESENRNRHSNRQEVSSSQHHSSLLSSRASSSENNHIPDPKSKSFQGIHTESIWKLTPHNESFSCSSVGRGKNLEAPNRSREWASRLNFPLENISRDRVHRFLQPRGHLSVAKQLSDPESVKNSSSNKEFKFISHPSDIDTCRQSCDDPQHPPGSSEDIEEGLKQAFNRHLTLRSLGCPRPRSYRNDRNSVSHPSVYNKTTHLPSSCGVESPCRNGQNDLLYGTFQNGDANSMRNFDVPLPHSVANRSGAESFSKRDLYSRSYSQKKEAHLQSSSETIKARVSFDDPFFLSQLGHQRKSMETQSKTRFPVPNPTFCIPAHLQPFLKRTYQHPRKMDSVDHPMMVYSLPSWTYSSGEMQNLAHLRLFYHFSSIFPVEHVEEVRKMFPGETNPRKICAAILERLSVYNY